jgi:hypothetical protein
LGTLNGDVDVHLSSTEHEDESLMDAKDDRSLEEVEEEKASGKTADIEEDEDPRIELQRSGVSCLAAHMET